MTCKDCIGYPFCSRGRNGQTNFYGKDVACNNVEYLCNDFKNKADFVEVVRCKDCKFRGTDDCSNSYYLECEGAYVDPMEDDDFCSYGERSDT